LQQALVLKDKMAWLPEGEENVDMFDHFDTIAA